LFNLKKIKDYFIFPITKITGSDMQSYSYLSKSIYLEVAKLIIHLKNKTTSFFLYKSYRHWQAILFIPVIVDLGKEKKRSISKTCIAV